MKICPGCGEAKPLDEFHRNRAKPDGVQSRCKACKVHDNHNDYQRNSRKLEIEKRREVQKALLKEIVADHKRHNPCVDCGNGDLRVLDFDHVRGKKHREIGALVSRGVAVETLRAEMAKCEVRCANCHRVVTYERRLYLAG